MKKLLNLLIVFQIMLFTVLPSNLALAASSVATLGDAPAVWPTVYTPYTKSDGTEIFDPGADEHPIDVDITSGVDKGVGKLPSMYVASDGTNLFVRLRVKGSPYDRKGGFLSTVWLVKLAVNGEAKVTIGLNGKSPHYDYVYVADEDGTNVQPIYATPAYGWDYVPGTGITETTNGHYFLDFQVPIQRITEIAPEITADTPVQLFFGTSKAANLSVINKEWMNNGSTDKEVNFSGLREIKLKEQPLTIEIDGGNSKQYSAANNTMTGKSSLSSGQGSLTIDNVEYPIAINNYSWSYNLPASITGSNGTYAATAKVTSNGSSASTVQDVMITGQSDTLTINGGRTAVTSSATPVLTGTYAGSNSNNVRIKVFVDGVEVTGNTGAARDTTNLTWNQQVTLPNPVDNKSYTIDVVWTGTGNNAPTFATAKQQLTYKAGITIAPISVDISGATAGAQPVITGTADGAKEVEVRIDGTTVEIVKPSIAGSWTTHMLEKPLSPGAHTITAIAKNEYGNTASDMNQHTVSEVSITIDNGSFVTINDHEPSIRGNTNALNGNFVDVIVENESEFFMYNTPVYNGRWEVFAGQDGPSIPDGTYTVTAMVTTSAGDDMAVQQLSVDTATVVTISNPAHGSQSPDPRPTLQGTSDPSATVELKIMNANNQVLLIKNVTAVQDPNNLAKGNWTFTPSEDLAAGTYTLTATASDLYGNEAVTSSTFTITQPEVSVVSASPVSVAVANGTALEAAKAALGTNVSVTLSDGTTTTASVTWNETTPSSYNGAVAGEYPFTGTLGAIAGATNPNGITAGGMVDVQPVSTVSISRAETAFTVPYGTSLGDVKHTLSNTAVSADLADGTTQSISVAWNDSPTPSYDGSKPGEYTFNGLFSSMPSGVDNNNNIVPTAKVTVLPQPTVSIQSVSDVHMNKPYGTNKEDAKAGLGTHVSVTLQNGSQANVPIIWSEEASPVYDGTTVGAYAFTGTFGTLPAGVDNNSNIAAPIGYVNILSNEADLVSYSFNEQTQPAHIDATARIIHVQVKYGTDLRSLIASFALSEHAQGAKIGDVIQTTSTPNDFTNPVVYTVIAQDGTVKYWTVMVTVQEKTATPDADIVRAGDRQINGTSEPNAVITAKRGGDIVGAAVANGSGNWTVDVTADMFLIKDDTLTITAIAYGKIESDEKTVQVQRAISSEKQLISTGYGNVDGTGNVINIPAGTKVSDLKAQFAVSEYASVEIVGKDDSPVANQGNTDVTIDMVIRVTAEDGSVAYYTIAIIRPVALQLIAEPNRIVGDGISKATLKAVLQDVNGNAVPNVEVSFSAEAGTLSAQTAVTNAQGEAAVTLTSPLLQGDSSITKLVQATVSDAAKGIFAHDEISIQFQPPVIVGQVLDASGNPIANTKVWVEVDGKKVEAVTDSEGNYSLTVPRGGQYTVYMEVITVVNGIEVKSMFTQKANVQASGKTERFKSERKVSGQLFVGTRNEKIKSMKEMFPDATLLIHVLDDPNRNITATIDQDGKYELTGFEAGETYEVVFNVEMNGQRLAGKLSEIHVGTDGQIIVQHELIDPFGMITDAATGKLVSGVNLKLYWANTELNKQQGRTPNTLVSLPELASFPPNKNSNPQVSTERLDNTDEIGNYAWMVFANGDYYIIGEKEGYVTYDSREDTSTNTVLGDSWMKDGIIHIGETMLRYDFSMKAVPKPSIQVKMPMQDAYITTSKPTLTGSASAPSGSKISVNIHDRTYFGTLQNKAWTVDVTNPLSDGTYTATATVTDRGVSAEDKVTFTIDTTKPELTVIGETEVRIETGETYKDAGATAVDNIDGDISSRIQVTGIPEYAKPGVYTITYVVADSAGHKAEASRTLIISPKGVEAVGSIGGKYTVTVVGAAQGATVTLYDQKRKAVATGIADYNGSFVFTNVPVDTGYTVTQIVNGVESGHSNDAAVGPGTPAIIEANSNTGTVEVGSLVPGATVSLRDATGKVIRTEIADEEGRCTFTGVEKGVRHTIIQTIRGLDSAEAAVYLQTDGEQVDETERGLEIGYQTIDGIKDTWESVTSDVYLLRTDNNETEVVWSSSHPDVVTITSDDTKKQSITAEVHRQPEEESVTVTATVSKGDVTKTRTFLFIVKATGVEKVIDTETERTVQIGSLAVDVQRINVMKDGQVIGKIDKLIITEELAQEIINESNNGTAQMQLFVDPDNVASEFAIEIDRKVITALAESDDITQINIMNTYGTLSLAKEQLLKMSDNNLDLFIRLVPITNETEQTGVKEEVAGEEAVAESADGKPVQVLGTPVMIETNYRGFETDVTFPLTDITGQMMNPEMLRVFIEHSDEKVVAQSSIVYSEANKPVGITFTIHKFSTFTMFEILENEQTEEPVPVEKEPNPEEEQPVEKPPVKEVPEVVQPKPALPHTATSTYNVIFIGLLAIGLGFATLFMARKRLK